MPEYDKLNVCIQSQTRAYSVMLGHIKGDIPSFYTGMDPSIGCTWPSIWHIIETTQLDEWESSGMCHQIQVQCEHGRTCWNVVISFLS